MHSGSQQSGHSPLIMDKLGKALASKITIPLEIVEEEENEHEMIGSKSD
jgi:hypothetical protein